MTEANDSEIIYGTDSSQQTPAATSPSFIVSDDTRGDFYHSSAPAQSPLRVGDFVTVGLSSATVGKVLACGVPPVAIVSSVWRTGTSWFCELRLMFRPGCRGAPAKKPFHGSAELIASADSFLECGIGDVSREGVTCEDADSFAARTEFPENAFFCRERQSNTSPSSSEPLKPIEGSISRAILAMSSPRQRRIEELIEQQQLTQPPRPAADAGSKQSPAKRKKRMLVSDESSREPDLREPAPAEEQKMPTAMEQQDQEEPSPPKRLSKAKETAEEWQKSPPKMKREEASEKKTLTPSELVREEAKRFSAISKKGSLLSWIERASSGSSKLPHIRLSRMPRLTVAPTGSTQRHHQPSPAAVLSKIAAGFRQPRIQSFLTHEEDLRKFRTADEGDGHKAQQPTEKRDEEAAQTGGPKRKAEEEIREDVEEPKAETGKMEEVEEEEEEEGGPHSTGSFVVSDGHETQDPAVQDEVAAPAAAPGQGPPAAKRRRGDGPLPWLFSLRQAFEVYLQYCTSCCLDREFKSALESSDQPENGQESAQYFLNSVQKVERELLARKECLIASSVWQPHFQKHLQSRPTFNSCFQKALTEHQDCEACNRSRHAAVFTVTLSGRPYDTSNVWTGDMSAAIDSSEDQHEASLASSDAAAPPATTDGKVDVKEEEEPNEVVYRLGRLCHQRAALFHRLEHFKYHLLQSLKRRLEATVTRVGQDVTDAQLVAEVLDDAEWVAEKYDSFKTLISEADSFGMDETV